MTPARRIWYPDEEVVTAVHDEMIHRYGGHEGLERGIKSFQINLEIIKKQKTLYKKASVFLITLLGIRIFVDGNHRTAFEVTDIFLRMNGKKTLSLIDDEEKVKFMKNMKFCGFDDVETWLWSNDDETSREQKRESWHEAFKESIKCNDTALRLMNIGSKKR